MTPSESTGKKELKAIQDLRQSVLNIVYASEERLTPVQLEKMIVEHFSIKKEKVKTVIKSLVADRDLVYTYQFGSSFLEKSFNIPTRISKRIVLKPPGLMYKPTSGEKVIELLQGASFGTGDHPSTRLAVRGIESVLSKKDFFTKNKKSFALDIGTGSGVLAMVAVLLGVERAVGIDIDPCARAEAKENIKLNHLEHQIKIYDWDAERIEETCSLISANLRYPTLKRLASRMMELTGKNGAIVVSGIKMEEINHLVDIFTDKGFKLSWKECEKNWAGLVFDRGGSK
jgi:ribosomal protein L11 methyltransferase